MFTLIVQSILAGLTNGFVYGLIGLGIAVVYQGSRVINAMQGDIALAGSVMAYIASVSFGLSIPVGFLVGMVTGGLAGYGLDRLMIRPTLRRRGTDESLLLVTLGGAFAISATVLMCFGRDSYPMPGLGGEASVNVFDASLRVHAICLIGTSLALVAGLRWFYAKTLVGQALLASSLDPEGALTLGINVGRMRALTFVLGGVIGGLAGVLIAPLVNIQYEMGLLLTLKGFAAAILGGLSSPFGAIFGGVLLGLAESLAILALSSGYKDVVTMTLLIGVMIVLPRGLFGRQGRLGG